MGSCIQSAVQFDFIVVFAWIFYICLMPVYSKYCQIPLLWFIEDAYYSFLPVHSLESHVYNNFLRLHRS